MKEWAWKSEPDVMGTNLKAAKEGQEAESGYDLRAAVGKNGV